MFSSTNDLIAFASAIHTNKLLPAAETRAWMKPDAHTSSVGVSVGASWEILRSDNITADGRLIDVYTKSGDLGLYHALLGIVPDYDVVISVLTAGAEVTLIDPYARSKLFSAVVRTLLPAIEEAGRDQAATRYEGTFVEESSNSTLVLTSDDAPGLLIESFTVRGYDVLNNIGSYNLASLESGGSSQGPPPSVEGRLYPTERKSSGASNGTAVTAWRAVFDAKTDEQKAALDKELFWIDGSCETWFGADRSAYNFLSLSDFHVSETSGGGVMSIQNKAFNVTLTKVSSGSSGAGDDDEDEKSNTDESGASLLQMPGLVVLSTLLTVVTLL